MKEEIWKDIPDFEGKYQVSNKGRVKSMARKVVYNHPVIGYTEYDIPERISKPYLSIGYYKIDLSNKPNKAKKVFIHRLIADAFIPKIDGKSYVNHKNGIRTDNRIENLEWCTQSENMKHAYAVLGIVPSCLGVFGDKHPRYGRKKIKQDTI
jgi:hypothetical protein